MHPVGLVEDSAEYHGNDTTHDQWKKPIINDNNQHYHSMHFFFLFIGRESTM